MKLSQMTKIPEFQFVDSLMGIINLIHNLLHSDGNTEEFCIFSYIVGQLHLHKHNRYKNPEKSPVAHSAAHLDTIMAFLLVSLLSSSSSPVHTHFGCAVFNTYTRELQFPALKFCNSYLSDHKVEGSLELLKIYIYCLKSL